MFCCPKCNFFFTPEQVGNDVQRCPSCNSVLDAIAFPAMFRKEQIQKGNIAGEEDARCAFHSDNQADVVCARCGRLICSLCSIPYGKQIVCPQCLDKKTGSSKKKSIDGRIAWDSLALQLVAHPIILLVWWATLPMALTSLVLSIIFYNKPPNFVYRGKWRFNLAMIMSLLWIAGWTIFIIFIVYAAAKYKPGS